MINQVRLDSVQAAGDTISPLSAPVGVAQQKGFKDVLAEAINGVHELQTQSKNLQQRYQLGDDSVSLEETMVAMNQASLSFQMLAQTRNKLTQAYSEVMSMPV